MIDNIDDSIRSLAVDIDLLKPLEGNARRGDVKAIKASYSKFGQLKPIVAVRDESGDLVVIAGNHQLQAARQLGWDQIAVAVVELDNDDALAFSLADNRISDLGSTDNALLLDMISSSISYDEEFFELLGWDDFSVAAIENSVISSSISGPSDPNAGWIAPEIVIRDFEASQPVTESRDVPSESTNGTSTKQPAPQNVSNETIVTQGSTATSSSGVRNAVIQFTLVFDEPTQQSKWYSFLKWLKESPAYDGETTAQRLLDFIAQHSPRG